MANIDPNLLNIETILAADSSAAEPPVAAGLMVVELQLGQDPESDFEFIFNLCFQLN